MDVYEITQILVQQAIDTLNATSKTVEAFRLKMDEIASTMPEYPVVIDMYGIGRRYLKSWTYC